MLDDWFLFLIPAGIIAVVLFILILVFNWMGYMLRRRGLKRGQKADEQDFGSLNGAMMGLLALLLAFTFGMANSRFDSRRALVIEEANAIGTVILRTEVYPDSMQAVLKGMLKEYVEARIAFYKSGTDLKKVLAFYKQGNEISSKIWKTVAAHAHVDDVSTRTSLIIPALNDMIDIVTTRRASGEAFLPPSILYFLFALCFSVSFMMGYDKKNRFDWIVATGFALMLSITIFTILDLDRPRRGLINLDKQNEKIVELRELFKE